MEKVGVFDIESTNWIDFQVGGFYDGKDYRTFERLEEFLDMTRRKKYEGFRIYAHNGGKFDFLFILDPLLKRKWVTDIIDRGGRIIALKIDNGVCRFLFCDSYALLPQSLAKLTAGFGVAHKKMEMDYTKVSKRGKLTLEYLKNDCLGLYEVLEAFYGSEYVVTPKLTIAAQALDTFRQKFCPCTIAQEEILEEEYIRDNFYHGGRVEVFKGYGSKLWGFDVNSLFPYAMLGRMPLGAPKHTTKWVPGEIGFYDVEITRTPSWYIPPYAVKENGKLMFYNGPGQYYLSSAMLTHLKERYGVRFKVREGLVFKQSASIFTEYVETFYKLKTEQKGGPLYIISKLFLNALYGKLGQGRYRETVRLDTGDFPVFESCDPLLDSYGYVLVPEKNRSRYILPYVAAWVTDQARLYHWRLMQEYGEGSIYYCDTDSFYTDKPPTRDFARRYVGSRLGQLSETGRGMAGVFVAPKCYALKKGKDVSVMFKGFSGADFSFQDMLRAARGGVLTQTRERILGYRETLRRKNDIKHSRGKFLKLVETTKTVESVYDKRLTIPHKARIFETEALTRAR
jgi:hypothetical protein